jgi:hypothetical protein
MEKVKASDPNWPYERFPYGSIDGHDDGFFARLIRDEYAVKKARRGMTGIYAGCRTVGDRLKALADHEDRRYADPGRDA